MHNKYIIGLGCSWTQGEGGYPDEIWEKYDYRPQMHFRKNDDYIVRHIEHENSWVNVLCRDHFTDHTPVNLGIKGIGNKAAVQQLYFCDRIDWQNSEGIIVLMLSGFERLDLPGTHSQGNGQDDGYSDGSYRHYKWSTAWPFDSNNMFWKAYAKELFSERMVATNQMLALLELQKFVSNTNYKIVVANGFNQRPEGVIGYLTENAGNLVDKFDWSCYIHNTTEYVAMIQKLIWMDNLINPDDWASFHQYYFSRKYPAEYLTNCEGAHPTIKGYKVIADELANFIKYKNYA